MRLRGQSWASGYRAQPVHDAHLPARESSEDIKDRYVYSDNEQCHDTTTAFTRAWRETVARGHAGKGWRPKHDHFKSLASPAHCSVLAFRRDLNVSESMLRNIRLSGGRRRQLSIRHSCLADVANGRPAMLAVTLPVPNVSVTHKRRMSLHFLPSLFWGPLDQKVQSD